MKSALSFFLSSCVLVSLAAPVFAQQEYLDVTDEFTGTPEAERLHWYEEINLKPALAQYGLSGAGVHITIMGEMVDATHPEIAAAVEHQYNAFAKTGEILPGKGNMPYRADLLTRGDGHGTHIAGTIAAACDGKGILGVSCGASLDVYALGAYDNADAYRISPIPDDGAGYLDDFIGSVATAMNDVAARGTSRIVTGSYNVEAPAIVFSDPSPVAMGEIAEVSESWGFGIGKKLRAPLFGSVSNKDRKMLARVIRSNGRDMSIAGLALLPRTGTFARMVDAFAAYQATGGVYLVTESNYTFEDRSSVLNALPALSDKIDPDLWLSVVMVQPEGLETVETPEELEAARAGRYITPINGCGTLAKDYCIVVPSYDVLSTMTERVSDPELSLFGLDGMTYQLFSGHSMGAPMVAGALALMQEYNTREHLGLSMKDLVRILKASANRNFEGYDPVSMGVGMLDVSAAIRAMKPE